MAVRGGGHNAAGGAMCDDGIVIDLSAMHRVDVDADTATVRADGGVTIGVLDAATQRHGLAVPMGVVTETGIAGLTLGGGYGWLRRKYGLSCDNLIAAEVVTADGRVVRASEQENPELLWGLRGGGGNFGVVTSFEFRAHPVGPDVYFAVVMHAGTDAVEALRFFREWAATAPDEISAIAVLWHAPEIEEIPAEHHGTPIVTFVAMHSGSPTDGEAALALACAPSAEPIADLSSVMPFLEVQQFFDEDYPKWERRYYWTSTYVTELADELIAEIVQLNEAMPVPPLQHRHLAGRRRPGTATGRRDGDGRPLLGVHARHRSQLGLRPRRRRSRRAGADRCDQHRVGPVRGPCRRPVGNGRPVRQLPRPLRTRRAPDFFGQNARRVAALKVAFDPENRFDRNHNLEPPSPPGRRRTPLPAS